MAPKNETKTEDVKMQDTKTAAPLATQAPVGALSTEYVPQTEYTGAEHIEQKDIQIARIAIAQALSPQIQEGDDFIEGLAVGQMFNSLTGENYGRDAITFVILRADPPRGIHFRPREEGGGVLDFNVPINDPRMQFTTNEKGERQKPVATMFYDYFIARRSDVERAVAAGVPLGLTDVLGLSMKSSQLGIARELNTLIAGRRYQDGPRKGHPVPIFVGLYTVKTAQEKGAKGTYYNYRVANAGSIPGAWGPTLEKAFVELRDKGGKVKVHVEDEREEDASFNPEV